MSSSAVREDVWNQRAICIAKTQPLHYAPGPCHFGSRLNAFEETARLPSVNHATACVQTRGGRHAGRWLAKRLALLGLLWSRMAARRMPEASGDVREIVNQPFFVPLFSLFRAYGPIFKLCIGPQTFVVVSDPMLAKQVRFSTAAQHVPGHGSHHALAPTLRC
jgi:hypothetical protein